MIGFAATVILGPTALGTVELGQWSHQITKDAAEPVDGGFLARGKAQAEPSDYAARPLPNTRGPLNPTPNAPKLISNGAMPSGVAEMKK